ncbi:MAG TPA: ABC transporter ATP-binding protein [Actinomycetes bacterium]
MTAALTVSDVTVYYGERLLLDRVGLAVQPDEVVCLLGPSGSGKSTLLQVIAGLQVPASGRIRWYDEDLTAVPTHRRGFGLVFQDPLLFPHLDVGRNVAYGLRAAGMPRTEAADRVEDLLALVDLAGCARRRAVTLSGGEAQRVALARALAPNPRLLLLDEPFGALDRELRDRLAVDVRALLHRLGTPAIHVTHDIVEAQLVGDRVVRLADLTGGGCAPV